MNKKQNSPKINRRIRNSLSGSLGKNNISLNNIKASGKNKSISLESKSDDSKSNISKNDISNIDNDIDNNEEYNNIIENNLIFSGNNKEINGKNIGVQKNLIHFLRHYFHPEPSRGKFLISFERSCIVQDQRISPFSYSPQRVHASIMEMLRMFEQGFEKRNVKTIKFAIRELHNFSKKYSISYLNKLTICWLHRLNKRQYIPEKIGNIRLIQELLFEVHNCIIKKKYEGIDASRIFEQKDKSNNYIFKNIKPLRFDADIKYNFNVDDVLKEMSELEEIDKAPDKNMEYEEKENNNLNSHHDIDENEAYRYPFKDESICILI